MFQRVGLLVLICLFVFQGNAQHISSDTLTALFERSISLYRAQKYPEAILSLQKVATSASAHDDRKGRAFRVLGLIYERQSKYAQAASQYEQAIEILTPLDQPKQVAPCQKSLANIYTRQGDYEKAIFLLQSSIRNHTLPPANEQQVGQCYMELGKAFYFKKEPEQSILYFEKALARPEISKADRAMASLFLGQFQVQYSPQKETRSLIEFALHEFRKLEEYAYELECLMAMGDLIATQYPQQAAGYYDQAWALSPKAYDSPFRREVAQIRLRQGDLYANMGKPSTALRHYQHCLYLLLPQQVDSVDIFQKPADSLFYCENIFLQVLEGKAGCFEQKKEPGPALAHYASAMLAAEKLRQCTDYTSSKFQLVSYQRTSLERALALAQQDSSFLEYAFFFMEKSKAQVMNETLHEVRSRHTHLPDSIVARDRKLARSIAGLEAQFAVERHPGESQKLHLDSLRYQQTLFRQKLEHQYPSYRRSSERINYVSLKRSQEKIPPNHLFIHYFVPKDSSLPPLALAMTSRRAKIYRLDTLGNHPEQLREILEQSPSSSATHEVIRFSESAFFCYQHILQPILEDFPSHTSLIIIPDGPLNDIPFEVLLNQKPNWEKNPNVETLENFWKGKERVGEKGAAYLLFDYQIQYAFSAGLWLEKPRLQKAPEAIQAYGPVYTDQDSFGGRLIPPLGSSLSHTQSVAALFGANSFTGIESTPVAFFQHAPQANYLHLALHSFADQTHPLRSALAFSKPKNTPHGLVFAADLYAMPPLSATLVSLLACKSGDGKRIQGEGVMSLGRAFRLIGAKGIVMSLWDADARLGGNILETMYANIKKGEAIPAALQQAKKKHIQEAKVADAHPRNWANYVLIGNPKVVHSSYSFLWFILGGLLILGVGILFPSKKIIP